MRWTFSRFDMRERKKKPIKLSWKWNIKSNLRIITNGSQKFTQFANDKTDFVDG